MQNLNDLFIQEETKALKDFEALTQDQLNQEALKRQKKTESYKPEIDLSNNEDEEEDDA